MRSAQKEQLQSYFQNNYQYEIPFFQRSYVWEEENWELFIENLEEEVIQFKQKNESEHFIGTIITKPLEQQGFDVVKHELIDGQQRLTTVTIMIKALADTSKGDYENLKSNLISFLEFKDTQNKKYYRLIHSKLDRPHFEKVMRINHDGNKIIEAKHQIEKAYNFFVNKFSDLSDQDRDTYSKVLLNKLPIIAMFLSENDDEQEIFDTINSLGVRLTIAELLKNYIFRDDELKPSYEEYWFQLFESEQEDVDFWNDAKTSGRIKRTNLELLLYCILINETGKEVRIDKLFNEFKKYLKDKTPYEKITFLKKVKKHAETYKSFPASSDLLEISFDETEKRVFHVIEYLEITTIYPLLLSIYDKVSDEEEKVKILQILESYLVRRLLCKLSTKNYNRFFIQLMNSFDSQRLDARTFNLKLMSYQKDTNRFPSDDEFKSSFYNSFLYNRYAREVLFIIVLHQLNNNYSDVSKLNVNKFSVEHILPKKWRDNWDNDNLTEEQRNERDWLLKRLGNLTLITRQLNSRLKNAPWERKVEILTDYSRLPITTKYLSLSEWNEEKIKNRANDLASSAIEIWKISA